MNRENQLSPTMIAELLEVIHNALLVVDSNHKIIFANSRTAKMFATSISTLLGKSFPALFMPEDVDILVPNILSITRMEGEIESEAMFLKKDGSTFLGHISGTCFHWAGNQEGMVYSIHDISDMKEIEKSLKRSERIAFLGRLVDDISHQIRNPIVAIAGFARRLQSDHPMSSSVDIILSEASRLEKLLNTLNRFAKLPRPKTQRIQMTDLLKEMERIVEMEVKKHGCTWLCSCDDLFLEENLLIDKNLFLEALLDVVKNSCEAYPRQSGIKEQIVRCEIVPSGDEIFPVTFKISDLGIGISENVKENVFSHFYTDKTGHIGMGLTFARRIIEEQGGYITIESNSGGGTTVNFHLIKERRRRLRTKLLS